LRDASLAIVVKSRRCDTERRRPGRSIAVSTASQNMYDRPIALRTASDRRTGRPARARQKRRMSAAS
jgi:hypothetical protein